MQPSATRLACDIKDIMKIGINQHQEDIIEWELEKSGIFSVPSVYRAELADLHQHKSSAASEAPDGMRVVWTTIWMCPAPSKVCTFMWRLGTNSLPTCDNKHSRNLGETDICPLCGAKPKNSFHGLCRWRSMVDIWRLLDLANIRRAGTKWIIHYSTDLPEMGHVMLFMTIW